MKYIKKLVPALVLFSALISTQANAAFINLTGTSPIFDIDIETSGTSVINVLGSFNSNGNPKTVTGLSQFNPTGNAFNFWNSPTDFDFSFVVNPVFATSLSESVRFYTNNNGGYEYQIGEVFDATSQTPNAVAFPGQGVATLSGVSVSAVPEPQTYGLFLAGLALLSFVNRKRA